MSQSATAEEIKAAFREKAKVCHPDISGDEGHELCVQLNKAYETLTDPVKRSIYDEERQEAQEDDGFTGEPLSFWCGYGHALSRATDPNERRAVFVDEATCIGCKNCALSILF